MDYGLWIYGSERQQRRGWPASRDLQHGNGMDMVHNNTMQKARL